MNAPEKSVSEFDLKLIIKSPPPPMPECNVATPPMPSPVFRDKAPSNILLVGLASSSCMEPNERYATQMRGLIAFVIHGFTSRLKLRL